jgi:ketosteroid isomerase-like protein
VIVAFHISGMARASGAPTEMRLAIAYTIRANKIVRGREYMTTDEALAAVARED